LKRRLSETHYQHTDELSQVKSSLFWGQCH